MRNERKTVRKVPFSFAWKADLGAARSTVEMMYADATSRR